MEIDNDLFCKIIKDKLKNYTLPVEDDSWSKIEERLNPPLRKKTLRPWISTIAVAASIALLLMLYNINKKTIHHETANQLSENEKTIIQNVSEKEIDQPVPLQVIENLPVFKESRLREQLAENNHTIEVIPEETAKVDDPVILQEEEPGPAEKKQVSVDFPFNFEKEIHIPPIKPKKRQSIRFSVGSGGNLLAENNLNNQSPTSDIPYFRSATEVVAKSKTEEILLNEEYSDVTHHLPFSFGISLKKELNRIFAIESGIVYSYMETSFRKETYPANKANLQLHYIGVPLNIHTSIYGNRLSQWEIYLSTGGMVEKGILSHFTQVINYENYLAEKKTVVSNEKIKGLQWSIGISPGVDYRINRNYSIYFEPGLSYYFDNNQPESARTKHPLVVGLNAGVRYMW